MVSEYVLILVTTSDKTEAEQISKSLVEKRLIACCNIIFPVSSFFRWKDEICHEQEALMVLKTVFKHFPAIVKEVKKLHSYETPEIIALPIIDGSEDYLNWIKTETSINQ